MEKKFISFIVALTVFVSIPIPVCSAEDWIYMGNYYDPSCYGSMRIYVDSDSMSLEDSSPGYSFIHKTGSLVKLLYSKYGQNYSSIWNISTNYYWHVNDSLAVGATLYWQPNHVYEYNTAGYLIGENDCRNEDERIAYQEYSVVDPGGHVRHVKSDKSYWPNNLIYDLDNFIYKYIKSGNRMKHIQGKKQDNLSEKDYPVPGISNGKSI